MEDCLSWTASALVMLGVATAATAQERKPPEYHRRYVSQSGLRYVLIGGRETTCFALCERGAGAPPVGPLEPQRTDSGDIVRIEPGAGDRVIASGTTDVLPRDVIVAERLDGFLLFENARWYGYGVTWVDGEGNVRFGLSLADLFDRVPKGAEPDFGALYWCRDYWLDERASSVLLLTVGDESREVMVPDGQVRIPGSRRLFDLALAATAERRANLLHALSLRSPAELVEVAPQVEEAFFGASSPMELRLRAGALLARANVTRLRATIRQLFADARNDDQPVAVRRYAVLRLVDVLGDEAVAALRQLLRGEDPEVRAACHGAFVACGNQAVPTLARMLEETGESLDYRRCAALSLCSIAVDTVTERDDRSAISDPKVREALFEAVGTMEYTVADPALSALEWIGGDDLGLRLIALLAKGVTVDDRIAYFLRRHPTRAALPAIEAALLRPQTKETREALRLASEACATATDGKPGGR